MRKRIFLDMDGVLSDFVAAAACVHHKDPALVTCYDIAACWQIDPALFWPTLGYDFWANLPLTPEARDVVRMCTDAVGLDQVAILTAPCRTNGCTDGKRDWIARHFPQFQKRMIISNAKYLCAAPHSLLVDDTDDKHRSFLKHGGHSCLFPRPWNSLRKRACDPLRHLHESLDGFLRYRSRR